MQIIPLCLFIIIFGHSLVFAAPIDKANKTNGDSLEVKQQKATAIASRLLKELAIEQQASKTAEQSSTNDDNKNAIKDVNQPETEKDELHVPEGSDESDEESIDLLPVIHELYEVYGDKDDEEPEDDESSSEAFENGYLLPAYREELLRYLDEQEESDESLPPMMHSQVMDDSIMAAEDH